MFGRQKFATLSAELLGTGILTFLILSVQRSTIGIPFFVATAAALALAVSTYVLHETSGAHFNPAITIGLWTARKVSTLVAIAYVAVQLVGGLLAGLLFTYFSNNHLQKVGGHYSARILVAEAVGTAIFSLGIASTVYKKYTQQGAAFFSGIAYMVGILTATAGNAALGLLNPAVALGVHAWVWGTYVLGPVLGAIIGINLYVLLFSDEALESKSSVSWPKLSFSASSASAKKSSSKSSSNRKRR
ncbi:MAG TPA: aquaporin [Patescibacteria group bacterium]|nr:aquaporin [Patescibacteria group bacterium]